MILERASKLGAPMPATAAALQINEARTALNGDEDFSSVISEMERMARVHGRSQPASLISRVKAVAAR